VSDADKVATASFDNSVGLWEGRAPTWLEGHDAAATAIAFGPNDVLVSGGDDFTVRLWGDQPRMLGRHKGKVTTLAVAPSGNWVASGSWDGSIAMWPLRGGVPTQLPDPASGVNAIAFAADGSYLFAGTARGELLRYKMREDMTAGAPVPLVKNGFGINRLVVGEGWIAYGAVDGVTRVIDADSGVQIADFTLERRPILAMSYHAQTGQIAVGDGHGYIMILNANTWRIERDFRATRRGPVWALAFSRDGSVIHAGGLDDAVYAWPVALLDKLDPVMSGDRSFLRDAKTMANGERQFMRKCSICHTLEPSPSRKAGPTLHGLFGRRAGTVPGYSYSSILTGSQIVWGDATIDALFDVGPDHFIPGSKMPMQVIARPTDRVDLIDYLKQATKGN